MVLIIKGSATNKNLHYNDIDLQKICKMMINMEHNRYIYYLDDEMKHTESFNKYTYKNVDYDITFTMGTILIYTKALENVKILIENLTFHLDKMHQDDNYFTPYSIDKYKSTRYTLLKPTDSRPKNRIIVTDKTNIIRTISNNETRMIWTIKIIQNHQIGGYLRISEFANSETQYTNHYLSKSVSTIIYDNIDLFNVSYIKQLNYPSIKQYSIYKKNIYNISLQVHCIFGLGYEIISRYMPEISTILDINESKLIHIYNPKLLIDINKFRLTQLDDNKSWFTCLKENTNLDQNADNIDNGNVDTCFISGSPLYSNIYILKVGTDNTNIDVYTNINFIPINIYLYYAQYNSNGKLLTFGEYLFNMCKYTVLDIYVVRHNISEHKAICKIPPHLIISKQKSIMKCISYYGCVATELCLYTINPKKNIIYIGVNRPIYDTDMMKYKDSNCVLFRCDTI